ncbi:hypothetical protein BCCGELA001_30215 [Bradyrhizobium sp. CCGE-LA001]|nr:hypothetical protein BCCGELA001_30215 [Bradyrhizobium sp. CCGE-LA001]
MPELGISHSGFSIGLVNDNELIELVHNHEIERRNHVIGDAARDGPGEDSRRRNKKITSQNRPSQRSGIAGLVIGQPVHHQALRNPERHIEVLNDQGA